MDDFGPAGKVNILLVDDQPGRLLAYETILADLGQNLVTARSGVEALGKLMKDDFAVVLLDVSMPGMDGFETAAMIHDHPRFERTPIIFVTGVRDSELDRLRGYKLGAVDYVSIPVVPEILRSKVAVLVELHGQRLALQRLNRSLADANTTLQAEKTRALERANADLETTNRALQAEVAERTRAEAALIAADRQKDEFLAILAHELRNPLAPIRNAIEIMRRVPIEDEMLRWSRDVIDRQAFHLTRLVDDLLDISRITRGTIHLSREPVRIGTIVTRAVEALQPVISEFDHVLALDCPGGELVVEGDPTRLVQVVGNLLSNAAKYTPPGGRIELAARAVAGQVELAVRDNGIGISADSQAKLFQLFSRLDAGEEPTPGGLGIGLALVRRLIEMHGGDVSVRSDGPGRGSEFVVRLPVSPTAAPTRVTGGGGSPPRERRRIVIADDNPDALESLALLLECNGHEVWRATNGAEAVTLAGTWHPDLALLDLGMPVLDGYEAARRIRAEPWGQAMRLVALSGWGQSSDLARSREAGFDAHLVKPVGFEALAQAIDDPTRVPWPAADAPSAPAGARRDA